jgi:hypothetical protein
MINLFPDMPLEVRAYLLLGLIGGIFFLAIMVLAVGNVRNTLRRAKEYETTDLHMTQEKKEKKPKKEKAKKEKPKKEKKPLFGKKKDTAVDMLAVPAGYEPEEEEVEEEEIIFAPTGAGEVVDDDLPDDWLTSPSEPQEQYRSPFDSAPSGGAQFDEDNGDEEEEEDYTSDSQDFTTTSESEQKKRSQGNDSSPFGGGVGLDI